MRYTFMSDDYMAVKNNVCYEDQNEDYCGNAIDKLAAYEDIGLSPEEIKLNMDGLDEYHKAEAEGQLARLPCKIGDMVYYRRERDIIGDTVTRIIIDGIDNQVLVGAHKAYMFCDFGRNVFLTCEEAEAALKGEGNE